MQECIIYNVTVDNYLNPLKKLKFNVQTDTTATSRVERLATVVGKVHYFYTWSNAKWCAEIYNIKCTTNLMAAVEKDKWTIMSYKHCMPVFLYEMKLPWSEKWIENN